MAFVPQNDLERSLIRAANDPAHRPQFLRDFLNAEIYIIEHEAHSQKHEARVLPGGYQIKVQPIMLDNGKSYLPVFSSLCRLQAMLREKGGYLACKSRDLMTITRGANWFLNPGADYGKEFLSHEITGMLDGSIWKPDKSWRAEQETEILLGQPACYPDELVAVLSCLFAKRHEVKRAYVAHFQDSASGEPSHTLIGVDADGDWDRIRGDVGVICRGGNVPDPPVDVIRITWEQPSAFERYFSTISPFYEQRA